MTYGTSAKNDNVIKWKHEIEIILSVYRKDDNYEFY